MSDTLRCIEARVLKMQREIETIRDDILTERTLRKLKAESVHESWPGRFVQISYLNENRLDSKLWDYIDGIGNLRVGDRVRTPRFHYPECEGVVMALGRGQDWPGPWKVITTRRKQEY